MTIQNIRSIYYEYRFKHSSQVGGVREHVYVNCHAFFLHRSQAVVGQVEVEVYTLRPLQFKQQLYNDN